MDSDEDHFNFEMVMNIPNYNQAKKEKESTNIKPENQNNTEKKHLNGKKFGRKGKKLILRKKKEVKKGEKRRIKAEGDTNDSKLYECHHPLCEKVFYDRNSYRKHLITHGEKQVKYSITQFVCQYENCGKRFLDNSKLKRHMLVHTVNKPYKKGRKTL